MIYLYFIIFKTIALCFYWNKYFEIDFVENGWVENPMKQTRWQKVDLMAPKNLISQKWLKIPRLKKTSWFENHFLIGTSGNKASGDRVVQAKLSL
jgi:hypothetical protein